MERQADSNKRLTFSQKWGDDPFTQSGHTQVPNALIVYAHRLNLRSEECWLITCILRFKYDASNPTPSQELLAELFGQSVDTVQRTIKKIVDKKLLKVERVRDEITHRYTHTVYDFTPLRFALNECHYQEHPEERPQMPVPISPGRATPHFCGLDEQSTQAAFLRPGFSSEPHRKSAASATPQICGVHIENKKNINEQEERALNVRGEESDTPGGKRSTTNGRTRGINAIRDKAVDEVISLTNDERSRRRFEQLWEIAERNESLNSWTAALSALKRRLRVSGKDPLDKPGAYFDAICIKELEKHEIFISSNAEKLTEGDVGDIIRQGLFGAAKDEHSMPEPETPVTNSKVLGPKVEPMPVLASKTTEQLEAEFDYLEQEGGAALEKFEAFVVAQREGYEAELAGMGTTAKERLLAAFDRPEKRRDLFRKWCIESRSTP